MYDSFVIFSSFLGLILSVNLVQLCVGVGFAISVKDLVFERSLSASCPKRPCFDVESGKVGSISGSIL